MRLTGIDALRYGALENACLSPLGQGLTVVLGPNESGKTTFMALTRHVLYGFPDERKKESSYRPRAGDRAGRLVFADADGEWAIERVEGRKGGAVSVSPIRGADRPELLAELVAGVSEPSYQAVFGFGLGDLAAVGDGAANDGIVAKLYAAGAGLTVNPMDVRAALVSRASDLYAPRAQKPEVNALSREIREAKQALRVLEVEAQQYAGEQARLVELTHRIAPIKARRDELEVAAHAADRDLQRLEDALEQTAAIRSEVAELDTSIAELKRNAEVIDVDGRVLGVAPELSAILEELSGFRQRVESMSAQEAAAEETERRIASGPSIPAGAADTAESRAALETWRDRLARLAAEADAAERAATQSAARAAGLENVAREQTRPAAQSATALPIAFASVAVVLGAVFAVAGLVIVPREVLVSVLGAAVALLGVVGAVVALLRRPGGAPAEPLTAEAARLRSDAEAARMLADQACEKLEAARSEWRTWLSERSLDAYGEDAGAVRQLLDDLRTRNDLRAEAERARTAAARERDAAEAWVVRLVDAVRCFDDSASQIPPLSVALELASRARVALERALAAQKERAEMEHQAATAVAARRALAERSERAAGTVAQIAAAHDLDASDPLPHLRALVTSIREGRAAAAQEYEELTAECSGLRARLDSEGRDDRMSRQRQELEGLEARAAEAGDAYIVATLAAHLMDRARERFDRERQPEVVRVAGRVFKRMTLGRYVDVRVPLEGGLAVVSAEGDVRPVGELSQGTAEQLYLALRVGLISSLGATGKHLPVLMDDVTVNYDPERLEAAATAVSELVSARQVVLFTCDPATADVMVSGVPGATLVRLDRCELRG